MSASDKPKQPPDLLSQPASRGPGVRRLNRLPILFVLGAAVLVVAAIGYTYRERLMQSVVNAEQANSPKPEPASGATVLNKAPLSGEIHPAATDGRFPSHPVVSPPGPAQQSAVKPSDNNGNTTDGDDEATKARHEAWQTYYQQVAQLQKERLTAGTSAMTAETALSQNQGGQQPTTTSSIPPNVSAGGPATSSAGGAGYGGGFGLPAYPPARVDASAQREKQAFLNQSGDVTGGSDDLQATLRDPASPFIVTAGTAIPAEMIGGISSDLPGIVIGQVAENIYDTATGRFLLIPQGSRLIGSYDNMVSGGQTRVGVIWNRIIYPDTESIDLGSMEGADQGGYAGFHDQINTHFWSKIGNALLISIAGAGVQLSLPKPPVNGYYSSQQITAAALGQQFGELGQEYARAGLSVPNTLEIRPGYRLMVMVNKDMHLRPYIDRRTASETLPIDLGPVAQ